MSSAAVVAHLRVATPTALGKEKQTVTLLHGSNKSHSILKKKVAFFDSSASHQFTTDHHTASGVTSSASEKPSQKLGHDCRKR